MYKIAKILAIILGVIGLVLWVLIVRSDDNEGTVGLMIQLGVWMTIIIAGITFLFSAIQLITHPDKLKKSLVSIGAFAVIIAVSYFVLASGTDIDLDEMGRKGIEVSEGTSKLVGAGLIAFYILAAVAVIAMLASGAKKLLSK